MSYKCIRVLKSLEIGWNRVSVYEKLRSPNLSFSFGGFVSETVGGSESLTTGYVGSDCHHASQVENGNGHGSTRVYGYEHGHVQANKLGHGYEKRHGHYHGHFDHPRNPSIIRGACIHKIYMDDRDQITIILGIIFFIDYSVNVFELFSLQVPSDVHVTFEYRRGFRPNAIGKSHALKQNSCLSDLRANFKFKAVAKSKKKEGIEPENWDH